MCSSFRLERRGDVLAGRERKVPLYRPGRRRGRDGDHHLRRAGGRVRGVLERGSEGAGDGGVGGHLGFMLTFSTSGAHLGETPRGTLYPNTYPCRFGSPATRR